VTIEPVPEGSSLEDEEDLGSDMGERTEFVRSFRAQAGKRIAVPVRIEPKVIFANERTFLKWMHFSVIVGTIATTLLNFTRPNDGIGFISAAAFTVAALASIAYSGGVFVFRAYSMRARSADGWYYDKYGPTVLCVVLGACILVNLALRLREDVTGQNIQLF